MFYGRGWRADVQPKWCAIVYPHGFFLTDAAGGIMDMLLFQSQASTINTPNGATLHIDRAREPANQASEPRPVGQSYTG